MCPYPVAAARGRASTHAAAGGADWWTIAGQTCVAAYQPIGVASLAASYINLANPGTYDAAPGVAPTFDAATGWTFNGSTQYLTTGITPNVDRSWSMMARFSTVATDGALVGWASTAAFQLVPRYTGNTVRIYSHGAAASLSKAGAQASGIMGISELTAYLNGANDGAILSDPGGAMGIMYIGARNSPGGANLFLSCKVQAISIYSTTLSGTDMAALSAAMAALT